MRPEVTAVITTHALPNRIASLLSAARQHQASLCFGMTRRVVDGAEVLLPDVLVLDVAAMKRRILSLFEHLQRSLSNGSARAVAAAQQVVTASDIVTYDYVRAMAEARETLAMDAA